LMISPHRTCYHSYTVMSRSNILTHQ
jgi:hypothetical protein